MPVVPWEGAAMGTPINCDFFYHAVSTLGLNVTTTPKKVVNFLGEKVHPRENPGYQNENYVAMGPEWLIRPCVFIINQSINQSTSFIRQSVQLQT